MRPGILAHPMPHLRITAAKERVYPELRRPRAQLLVECLRSARTAPGRLPGQGAAISKTLPTRVLGPAGEVHLQEHNRGRRDVTRRTGRRLRLPPAEVYPRRPSPFLP